MANSTLANARFHDVESLMTQADRIRSFVLNEIVRPARASGLTTLVVKAGDVHRAMGLANAYPAVCSVLRGAKLQHEGGLSLDGRDGPPNGANVWFRFSFTAKRAKPAVLPASSLTSLQLRSPTSSAIPDLCRALVLVSCSKMKLDHPAPARDLYSSTAFRLKRALAEHRDGAWVILSAKHGVLNPEQVVEPYDLTLTSMGVKARKEWAQQVLTVLLPLAVSHGKVISFAGQRYVEYLLGPLEESGVIVQEPLKGLRQGEQLALLSRHQ